MSTIERKSGNYDNRLFSVETFPNGKMEIEIKDDFASTRPDFVRINPDGRPSFTFHKSKIMFGGNEFANYVLTALSKMSFSPVKPHQ